MKRVIALLNILFCLFLITPTAHASSASASLTSSNRNVRIGQTTTINVVINASARIRGGQFNLSLNNNNFEIVSVSGANGLTISSSGNFQLLYRIESGFSIPAGSSIATITVRPRSNATVGSTSVVTVSNVKVTLEGSYETVDAGSSSTTLTVASTPTTTPPPSTPPPTQPVDSTKSSNNNLSNLSTELVDLEFDPTTLNYDVTVQSNVTSLNLTATTQHDKATVKITGDENFKVGMNVVIVEVTAEDGSKKTYTINVNRLGSSNNNLRTITIRDVDFEFDRNVLNYTIDITDKNIDSLQIEYELEDENSTVEIIGNENLTAGKNVIKIIVTSEDGERKTYTITANILDESEIIKPDNKLQTIWIIVSVLLAAVVIVQFYILSKRKKEQ